MKNLKIRKIRNIFTSSKTSCYDVPEEIQRPKALSDRIWRAENSLKNVKEQLKLVLNDKYQEKYDEKIKQMDIAILFDSEDDNIGSMLEKYLRKYCKNVRIVTSGHVALGDNYFDFYKSMLEKSSKVIVLISDSYLNNWFFNIIESEVTEVGGLIIYNIDSSFRKCGTWMRVLRDRVTKLNHTNNPEKWADELIYCINKEEMFCERVERELKVAKKCLEKEFLKSSPLIWI